MTSNPNTLSHAAEILGCVPSLQELTHEANEMIRQKNFGLVDFESFIMKHLRWRTSVGAETL